MARTHAKALLKIDGVMPVAVCSRSTESGDSYAEAIGAEVSIHTNFHEMLDTAQPDLVYICVPPHAHQDEVEMAAAAGCHLFLEKPIAFDLAAAEAMQAAIDAAGVKSQVGYHMRFHKGVTKLRKLIADGCAGKPTLFEGRFWCNMDGSVWWRDASKARGQVYEQLIHLYDLALMTLGTPSTITGSMRTLCRAGISGYTVEDTSLSMIQFESGALGSISGSNCAARNRFIGDYRVVFEHATLDFTSDGDWRTKDTANMFMGDAAEAITEDGDPYLAASQDLIDAIRNDRFPVAPIATGVDAIRLVTRVMESAAASGRWLPW